LSKDIPLSPTSYIVLGLLKAAGPSTPYALKQGVAGSIGNFWSVPHSQLYAEPARLARAGYAEETRERGGRRRRTYAITDKGERALRAWLADPVVPAPELRDPALLKMFFGGDPAAIAPAQVERYRLKLAEYQALRDQLAPHADAAGPVRTLDAGIAHAEVWITYWTRLAQLP
jgi:PadR family transcriptional regulator AphA